MLSTCVPQDVFEAVQASNAYRGVVPFENSTYGPVLQTLDLFAGRHGSYPDVLVGAEAYLNVHHFLLGRRSDGALGSSPDVTDATTLPAPATIISPSSRTTPLISLGHIDHVYSHPQALGQCERFLSTFLKAAKRHETASTSKAAELVAEHPAHSVAISSCDAALAYHLDILAQHIEDKEDNTTRFFILQKGSSTDRQQGILSANQSSHKSLLSFTVYHLSPGALAEALLVFKSHRLNLTSINSRPSNELPWHYTFFVEFKFNLEEDEQDSVAGALDHLKRVVKDWRWLGTWLDRL